MKIKVKLEGAGAPATDLLITADAAATVGDVANHLRIADPRRAPSPLDQQWTLSLRKESQRLLDPRTPLSDSPIRSGAVISLLPASRQFTATERLAVAVATVLEGLGKGREYPLVSGTNIVGRVRTCDVRLEDPLVSRQHARINVTDHIEIIDLGSANGIELNGSLISREVVRPADVIRIGDTLMSVRLTQVESAVGRSEGAVGFIRSPRLAPRFVGQEFTPPDVPQRQQRQHFPISMLVLPLLMAGVMYLVTRQWQTLLFAGLSPLMMIGSWWEQRRQGRTADKAAIAGFRADIDGLVADVQAALKAETIGRLAEHPATGDCIAAVHERRPLMWTRRPGEWGFLEFRLGTGRMPSRHTIKPLEARNAPRDLASEGRERLAPLVWVDGVPVTAIPGETGGVGVAGPRGVAVSAARALVVQAAALHSPAELAITLLTSHRNADDWGWLKWLPQVDAPWSPVEARHLAATPSDAGALLGALEALVEARLTASQSGPEAPSAVPAVLVVVESDSPVEFGRLVELAETGRPAGVHVLWIAPDVEQLPAACRTFVDTQSISQSGVGYVHEAAAVMPVATEMVSAEAALDFALSLSPVVDLGARNEDSSDLPRSISFLAMDGYEAMAEQPEAVLERWTQNHSILTGPRANEPHRKAASLRAAVGHAAGHLQQLDLRTDGPHALVGGTTGAGKSELLQTWILSMAANHSPQRLNFLLVDYKGGSAFAECDKLPHTVGMVTNLDANGVQRALKSLTAELDHRMKLLQDAKAKDLMELEKRWDTSAPPSLVIVVDEFAALVQEVPEFVDGVVNVAQRGRSLGLHLILATQRPAGVIKDNLRANTNLRLALRVADEADSTDVLGVSDAAFFDPDLPGRAVSKTGAGRLRPFQTAYAGGRTGSGPAAPDLRVEELVLGTGGLWEVPETLRPKGLDNDAPSDIARIVDTITSAGRVAELPEPRKPWLDELGKVYDVVDLSQGGFASDKLVLGQVDDPDNQSQFPVYFEPDRSGNLAIFGASGSGKSAALRTLAVSAGLSFRFGPNWVYGLDFGAQGLAMLDGLPHVGGIVRGNDDERVRRLITWLAELVDDRAARYAAVNAGTITEYRAVSRNAEEPRILLLLDGLSGFLKAYETNDQWIDRLVSIASAGRPVGVHVVVTGDRSGGIPTHLAATIQQRLVLRMTTVEEYDNLAVPRFILNSTSPAGRGIWEGRELQVGVLCPPDVRDDDGNLIADLGSQAQAMADLAVRMRAAGAPKAPPIQRLPEAVSLEQLVPGVGEEMSIGLRDDTLSELTVLPEGTFVIAGPPSSGRTTGMQTMVSAFRRARPGAASLLFTQDRRSALLASGPWTATAVGVDDAAGLADDWSLRIGSIVTGPVIVVLEKVAEWADTSAEYALDSLLKAVKREGGLILSDGEAVTYGRNYGLQAVCNTSRVGFLLQPDVSDGNGFGADLPRRLNRAEFPPGRGFLVRGGRVTLAQMAAATSH